MLPFLCPHTLQDKDIEEGAGKMKRADLADVQRMQEAEKASGGEGGNALGGARKLGALEWAFE